MPRKKKPPTLAERLTEWMPKIDSTLLRRGAVIGSWVAVIATLVVAWSLAVPVLSDYAGTHHSPATVEVRFVNQPRWITGDLERHLLLTARQQINDDPLRQDDLVATRSSLQETGWFTDVRQVRRVAADCVEVTADFARPFAVIRDFDGDHVVDPSGQLLPQTYAGGRPHEFMIIKGAHYQRPARAGLLWEGADIVVALDLKHIIDARPWRDQVKAIDVSDYQRDKTVSLITDRGYRIRWGRAPGEEGAGEVTTKRKLYYLDYPFEHYGHIDGGYDGDLDITDPRGVFGR